ncbi:hypothetical protein [Oricola sp.]|uniref:hypothetical protein n=1 Tax=Oricola sp. TaxID=1979950 RepID=UPI0025F1526C|nr:hypothetical protein [Oricola sp.]MCI5075744.1 hypothetical protein [Oricola sp.]
MHQILTEIPGRVLENATYALTQANMHAVFSDPGNEHWGNMSVLNAAHAGELFLKAIVATEHPLLIFKNIFDFGDNSSTEISLERLLQKAKTHDLQHLPKILWAVKGERIPDMDSFERIRSMRNAIQHFYHPAGFDNYGEAARDASLKLIYNIIDPLINKYFGLCAIEFHEDHSIGYDYVVATLLRRALKFNVPNDFHVGEIDIMEECKNTPKSYKDWVVSKLL